MRAIFISYRRDDSEGQAGRLFDDLKRKLGEDSVFMDVSGIEPGLDFRKVIDDNVRSCDVLLAVIGPGWVDAKDESGQRRLDNSADFVRLETSAALKRAIPVVPVLVHGARMPRADQLPMDLQELAYRNAAEVSHARWDSDVDVLIKALRRHVKALDPPTIDHVAALIQLVPSEFRDTCRPVPSSGVRATVSCSPREGPEKVTYHQCFNSQSLKRYYEFWLPMQLPFLPLGGQPGTDQPYSKPNSKGRRYCVNAADELILMWTNEDLLILAEAHSAIAELNEVFRWWQLTP